MHERSLAYSREQVTATSELDHSPLAIVVAHPDDEVIGVGGQLARWSSAAAIVHVTDGVPPDVGAAVGAGFASRRAYANARRRELLAALACLPAWPACLVR